MKYDEACILIDNLKKDCIQDVENFYNTVRKPGIVFTDEQKATIKNYLDAIEETKKVRKNLKGAIK